MIKIRPLVYLEEREDPTPVLPEYTIRLKFKDGVTPSFYKGTGVLYDAVQNIWDLTYENSNWNYILEGNTDLLEVLGGNISNVTNLSYMFSNCTSLTTVPLFDTSNVTSMDSTFSNCASLTTVPLFDTSNVTTMRNMLYFCNSLTTVPLFNTSSVTNMNSMLYNCYKVESGALALYQQASSQVNPPSRHNFTFCNCGRDTTTGSAELSQIPSDWK